MSAKLNPCPSGCRRLSAVEAYNRENQPFTSIVIQTETSLDKYDVAIKLEIPTSFLEADRRQEVRGGSSRQVAALQFVKQRSRKERSPAIASKSLPQNPHGIDTENSRVPRSSPNSLNGAAIPAMMVSLYNLHLGRGDPTAAASSDCYSFKPKTRHCSATLE
jgi:hypothetical protein